MEKTINEMMSVSMSKLKDMVDVNTVVGKPITSPDGVTLIPVSRMSFGFASGGGDYPAGFGGGCGAGVKADPIGFLVVKDGSVRMLNIAPPAGGAVERILDMLPDVLDRIEGVINSRKSDVE